MTENSKELASIIAAFIDKHGPDRRALPVNGYEFIIKNIFNIDIEKKSINVFNDGSVQFYGRAEVTQQDKASNVSTDEKVFFNGIAFFALDSYGDNCLLRVSIDNIKILGNENKS